MPWFVNTTTVSLSSKYRDICVENPCHLPSCSTTRCPFCDSTNHPNPIVSTIRLAVAQRRYRPHFPLAIPFQYFFAALRCASMLRASPGCPSLAPVERIVRPTDGFTAFQKANDASSSMCQTPLRQIKPRALLCLVELFGRNSSASAGKFMSQAECRTTSLSSMVTVR